MGAAHGIPVSANDAGAMALVQSLGESLHVELRRNRIQVTTLVVPPTNTAIIEKFGDEAHEYDPNAHQRRLGASVRARLLNRAKAEKTEFGPLLTRFALERLLYRRQLRGFTLRVQPSGVRSYYARFGRNRRVALGKVGTLLPDEARARCQKVLGNVAHGRHPLHGLEGADGVTLGEFIETT